MCSTKRSSHTVRIRQHAPFSLCICICRKPLTNKRGFSVFSFSGKPNEAAEIGADRLLVHSEHKERESEISKFLNDNLVKRAVNSAWLVQEIRSLEHLPYGALKSRTLPFHFYSQGESKIHWTYEKPVQMLKSCYLFNIFVGPICLYLKYHSRISRFIFTESQAVARGPTRSGPPDTVGWEY